MPLNELTITLAGPGRLGVETLTKTLENALNMLRSLETEIVASGTLVRWEVVRIRMRSPCEVTVAPNIAGKASKTIGRRIVKTYLQGVQAIERSAIQPEHFNDEVIDAARDMFKVANKDGTVLKFSSNNKNEVVITQQAFQHVEEIVEHARIYLDYGTIEGKLESLSVHDRLNFTIWEALTDKRVDCFVDEDLFGKAYAMLRNRVAVRVAVSGRVKYRNHVPKSIQVESIRQFPDDKDLPEPKDIGPINITDGLSSEEFVWRLRNG